jgi:hypothetical protein
MANNITMVNMTDQMPGGPPSPALSFEDNSFKPKGHAIGGVDYGIDMVGDEEMLRSPQSQTEMPPPPQSPPSPPVHQQPRQQQSHSPSPPYQNHQTQSMGDGLGSGNRGEYQDLPNMGQMPGFGGGMDSMSMGQPGTGFADGPALDQLGYEDIPVELSYEEKRSRKTDALASLARLESQGYEPAGKKGSHTTELDELEAMVEKLTAQRSLDNSIKFQRKILVGFATLAESICEKEEYNIFELDLEGWSESLYENVSEYDEVFEELYNKYKDVAKIPPEIKLVSMVAGSAWMFHMSRNMFDKASSKVPGFDDVMKHRPELKQQYQQAATEIAQRRGVPVPNKKKDKNGFDFMKAMMTGGTDIMRDEQPQQQLRPQRQRQPQRQPQPQRQFREQRQPQLQPQAQPQPQDQPQAQAQPQPQAPQRQRRTRIPMDEPADVDNLLGSLATGQQYDTDDEMDLSEMENMEDLDMMYN